MKEYFKRLQEEKTPHERRQWSLRAAMAVTTVIFLGWAGSLGLRFTTESGDSTSVAQSGGIDIQSQLASVVSGVFGNSQQPNTLEVATTTVVDQGAVQQ